jgi:hypothetical protein
MGTMICQDRLGTSVTREFVFRTGRCPTTCYDCAGWQADPSQMWLIISLSCAVTPITLTLFQSWLQPRNADGSLMRVGDVRRLQEEEEEEEEDSSSSAVVEGGFTTAGVDDSL